jgi:hypothetical protein
MYNTIVYLQLRPDDTIVENTQSYMRKLMLLGGQTYLVSISDRQLSHDRHSFSSAGIGTLWTFNTLAENAKAQRMTATKLSDGHSTFTPKDVTELNFRAIIKKLDASSMLVLRGHGNPLTLGGFQPEALAQALVDFGINKSCFINLTGCKLGLSPPQIDRAEVPYPEPEDLAEQISRGSWARIFAKVLYENGGNNRIHARLRSVTFVDVGTKEIETRNKHKGFERRPVAPKNADVGRKITTPWANSGRSMDKINHQPFSKIVIVRGDDGGPKVSFYDYDSSDINQDI